MRALRILVCGGRDFTDRALLGRTFAATEEGAIEVLIHGCARGADSLAQEWADEVGICCLRFPADWKKHGRAAGPIRNQRMLDEGKPDVVVAFPGGRGTADMVRRARSAGIPVQEIAAP